jgi:hypothetical protein
MGSSIDWLREVFLDEFFNVLAKIEIEMYANQIIWVHLGVRYIYLDERKYFHMKKITQQIRYFIAIAVLNDS